MKAKTVSIDFGHVYPFELSDRNRLVNEIAKNMQLNVREILEASHYKVQQDREQTPMRLLVTVELTEA